MDSGGDVHEVNKYTARCIAQYLYVTHSHWSGIYLLMICFLNTLLIPAGKFGPPFLGTAAARAALPIVVQVHAGSFRVSVIHQTLTWITGSLTCVRGHCSYACVYKQGGWAHRQCVGTTFLTRKNTNFSGAKCINRVQTRGHWCQGILSRTLYPLSHPVTPILVDFIPCEISVHKQLHKMQFIWCLNQSWIYRKIYSKICQNWSWTVK